MEEYENGSYHSVGGGSLDGGPRYSSSHEQKPERKFHEPEESPPERTHYKDLGEDNWPPTMGDKLAKICVFGGSIIFLGYLGLFRTLAQHALLQSRPAYLGPSTAWIGFPISVIFGSIFAIPTIILSIIALILKPRYHKRKAIFGLVVGLGFYLVSLFVLIMISLF